MYSGDEIQIYVECTSLVITWMGIYKHRFDKSATVTNKHVCKRKQKQVFPRNKPFDCSYLNAYDGTTVL